METSFKKTGCMLLPEMIGYDTSTIFIDSCCHADLVFIVTALLQWDCTLVTEIARMAPGLPLFGFITLISGHSMMLS